MAISRLKSLFSVYLLLIFVAASTNMCSVSVGKGSGGQCLYVNYWGWEGYVLYVWDDWIRLICVDYFRLGFTVIVHFYVNYHWCLNVP